MSIVGFDIGNESCIVAVARQRGIDVVLNDESKRETPAVVCFGDKQRFIGTAGAASTMANPKNAVTQIKRLLGRKFNDPELQRDLEILPFTVFPSPDGFPLVHVNYLNEQRTFTPTQVLAMILSDLKRMAEKNLNAPVVDCCIGVPVYFTDLQRRAVLDAAEIAGLHPLRLFHETTATALGYGIYKSDLPEKGQMNVVFVDIGHASMQVCIAGFSNGQMKVLAHSYDRSLGGRDFDEVLFKHFAGKFKDEYKIDVYQNARACLRLRVACEKLKKVLSANPEAPLNIECLMDEKDVRGFIKREEFEQISSPILEHVKSPLEKALAEAGLTVKDIHSIEVVGSGSRVPAIMKILRGFFGKEPRRTMNASECVARGCALQCAILSPTIKVKDFEVHERFPFSIAYSEQGSVLYSQNGEADIQDRIVFPKGVPIPITKSLTFFHSNTFSIHFMYTGTGDLHVPNISKYLIGPFQMTNVGGARFEVKVCLNIHGIISVESVTMLKEVIESPLSTEELLKPSIKLDADESDCQDDAEYTTDSSGSGTKNVPLPGDKSVQMVADQADVKCKTPQKKNLIKVPVSVLVFGRMTSQEVHSATETELELTQQDRVMEKTKDVKNAVEAYVYDMRNKLDRKYNDFVSAEEKKLLCKQLQEVEDWLYEDGEDVTMEAYVAKLEEMKEQGGKVVECYKDWTERELAIQELKYYIAHYSNLASCDNPIFYHISTEEKQEVIDTCGNASMWLHEICEQQNLLPKYVVPTLHAADVRSNVLELVRFCRSIMGKPKPPRTELQSLPTAELQHPLPENTVKHPEDTAQQPQGGDLAVDPQSVARDVKLEANVALIDIDNMAVGTTEPTPKHV